MPIEQRYQIVRAMTIPHLEDQVSKMIEQGWIPIGGMNPKADGIGQAMWLPAEDQFSPSSELLLEEMLNVLKSIRERQ